MYKQIFAFSMLFICCTAFADNISFKASINKSKVALNDSFVYSITISGDSSQLPQHELPSLTDFNRYGTSTSQSMSIINGNANVSITYSYTLGPKKIGNFTILPAQISYKGKTYSTESIEIEVTPAQSVQNLPASNTVSQPLNQQTRQSTNPQNASQNQQGKAFVKSSVNKKMIYENEKLVYTFKFYTNVDLLENPEYAAPDFSGFWNDGSKHNSSYELVDGVNYRVDTIETVLFPVGVGIKKIAPAKLKISVMDFSNNARDDFFNAFFSSMGRGQTKILQADEVSVNVMSLPLENKPADFNGAIGNFKIKSEVDKTAVNTNDPVTLMVSVYGNGNMKSVSSIKLKTDNNFKKYDTITSNQTEAQKEFKTILLPLAPGQKEIPPASLTFFNPSSKKYETIETEPILIDVSGNAVYETSYAPEDKKTVVKEDIRYNKQIPKLKNYGGYFVQSKWFYIAILPFIFMFLASFLYKRFFEKLLANKLSKDKYSFSKAKKLIGKAENEIDCSNFNLARDFTYLALTEVIGVKIQADSSTLQKAQIIKMLNEKEVHQIEIAKIEKLLTLFDFYRFADVKLDLPIVKGLIDDVKDLL
ncbi:MAG: BatD family protein [Elusimicrobiota bacterium]|jgi:hypothetical protein|nr:BatD family protein [Elusimicrobiota bacterium]